MTDTYSEKKEFIIPGPSSVIFPITERLFALLQGERVIARIDQNVVYRSLLENWTNIYTCLLDAGYLKIMRKELQPDGNYLCELSIPNKEVSAVYKNEILLY